MAAQDSPGGVLLRRRFVTGDVSLRRRIVKKRFCNGDVVYKDVLYVCRLKPTYLGIGQNSP
jgi:hypothetical protein